MHTNSMVSCTFSLYKYNVFKHIYTKSGRNLSIIKSYLQAGKKITHAFAILLFRNFEFVSEFIV